MFTESLAGLGYIAVGLETQTVIGIYRVASDNHPAQPDSVTVASHSGLTFPLRVALARELCRELPPSVRLGDRVDGDGRSLC